MARHTKYTPLAGWYQPTKQRKTINNWQDGDIAFLKSAEEFNLGDYEALIETGYLNPSATKHPVIILEHSDDRKHFLVTTVSAYSSGKENNYLPPWKQYNHKRKCRDAFRAFAGSEKPFYHQEHLQLVDGGSFPKPETSWVYTHCSFVVPSSTLKEFDKTPKRLCMTRESLKDLLDHMARGPRWATRWVNREVSQLLKPKEPRANCWQNYNRFAP